MREDVETHPPRRMGTWRRRHQIDIFADILKNAKSRIKKTHLCGSARLNYYLMQAYLEDLLKWELLDEESNFRNTRKTYKITQKGETFLDNYEKLTEIIHYQVI